MISTNAAIVVKRDHDRFEQPTNFLNGRFDIKLATDDAGGVFIVDTIRTSIGGPPMHLHHEQDEWWLVQEGSFRFQIGENIYDLGPGDTILGPRGVPHAFVNVSPTARLLVAFFPAGSMQAFFAHSLLDPRSEEFRVLSRQHGMEVVGPPLSP